MEYYRNADSFNNDGYHYAEFRFKGSDIGIMDGKMLQIMRHNGTTIHPTITSQYPTTFRICSNNEDTFCNKVIAFYNYSKSKGFNL